VEKGIVLGIDLIKERIKIAVTDFSGEIINTYHGFKGNEKIDVDKNIVFIEISNGIGAGIIVDNHLLRGTYGSAGEIGFSIINNKNLGFIIKNKGGWKKMLLLKVLKKGQLKKFKRE